MSSFNEYRNGEYVGHTYAKCRPGHKKKNLTLYACRPNCDKGQLTTFVHEGFKQIKKIITCPHCNGTGKNKRTVSVYEKDYYIKMKADRKAAGMDYRGK